MAREQDTAALLVCESHDVYMHTAKLVPSRSVGFRTYSAIVMGGFCTCLAIVPVSAAVFHLRIIGSAEALPILCVRYFR